MLTTYKINHTSKKIDWVVFQSLRLKSHLRFWLKFTIMCFTSQSTWSCSYTYSQDNFPQSQFTHNHFHYQQIFQPCHASLFQSIKEISYATYLHMHKTTMPKTHHKTKQNKTKLLNHTKHTQLMQELNNFPHT